MINQRSLDNLTPIKKGQVLNPNGRPKGIVSYIKGQTNDLKEMIDVMVGIMRGDKIKGVWGSPNYTDIREAVKWLMEYSYGKPPVQVLDELGEIQDIRKVLLVELTNRSAQERAIHVTAGPDVEKQDMAAEQPLHDKK